MKNEQEVAEEIVISRMPKPFVDDREYLVTAVAKALRQARNSALSEAIDIADDVLVCDDCQSRVNEVPLAIRQLIKTEEGK